MQRIHVVDKVTDECLLQSSGASELLVLCGSRKIRIQIETSLTHKGKAECVVCRTDVKMETFWYSIP